MVMKEEQQAFTARQRVEHRGRFLCGRCFDYPVRFEGNSAIITVHKMSKKKEVSGRDYDVTVDRDVYDHLKLVSRCVSPYQNRTRT
jgi:hypothetical protein